MIMSSITIRTGSLTRLKTQAIVNPAREDLKAGSGISRTIFREAGAEDLEAQCQAMGHCQPGQAVLTGGGNLPIPHIIHTVCPVWKDGKHREPQILTRCYHAALDLAAEQGISSVGFPLLATGPFGYPTDRALRRGLQACNDWLWAHPDREMDIVLVVRGQELQEKARKELQRQQQVHRKKLQAQIPPPADPPESPFALATEAVLEDWAGTGEYEVGGAPTPEEQQRLGRALLRDLRERKKVLLPCVPTPRLKAHLEQQGLTQVPESFREGEDWQYVSPDHPEDPGGYPVFPGPGLLREGDRPVVARDLLSLLQQMHSSTHWDGICLMGPTGPFHLTRGDIRQLLDRATLCQDTEQALRTFAAQGCRDRQPVLDALVRDIAAGNQVLAPCQAGDGDPPSLALRGFQEEAGGFRVAVFTSPAQCPKEESYCLRTSLRSLLNTVVQEDWSGIRLNPEQEAFDLDSGEIRSLVDRADRTSGENPGAGGDSLCLETEQAIRAFAAGECQDGSQVVEAMVRDIRAGNLVLIPARPGTEEDETILVMSLKTETGETWLPVLTSDACLPEEEECTCLRLPLLQVLNTALARDTWAGIRVNPWHGNFRLNRQEIRSLLRQVQTTIRIPQPGQAGAPDSEGDFCLTTGRAIDAFLARSPEGREEQMIRQAMVQDLQAGKQMNVPLSLLVDPRDLPGREENGIRLFTMVGGRDFHIPLLQDDRDGLWLPLFTSPSRRSASDPDTAGELSLGDLPLLQGIEPDSLGVWINHNSDGGIQIPWDTLPLFLDPETPPPPRPRHEQDLGKGEAAFAAGDLQEAVRCFQRAATACNPAALSRLGACFAQGLGVQADRDRARRCWERAATLGDGYAACRLGDMYRNGDLPRDVVYSNALYRRAWELTKEARDPVGYPDACLRLLRHCRKGHTAEDIRILAQDAADGFRARMDRGDQSAAQLWQEAAAILEKEASPS